VLDSFTRARLHALRGFAASRFSSSPCIGDDFGNGFRSALTSRFLQILICKRSICRPTIAIIFNFSSELYWMNLSETAAQSRT